MTGSDVNGKVTNGKLTNLNLTDASIVSGGSYYYCYYNNFGGHCFWTSNNTISESMFEWCTQLKSIILPNSVTSIESAFALCSLTSVTIPVSVTSIGALLTIVAN